MFHNDKKRQKELMDNLPHDDLERFSFIEKIAILVDSILCPSKSSYPIATCKIEPDGFYTYGIDDLWFIIKEYDRNNEHCIVYVRKPCLRNK